ncbi:4-phosphoerythronate dehydrogenase [Moraxella nasicaprae]|uniref:Erythronate-4-phosphate dehydrogenase n=1 Tax=Moraxella nasicaprae TaxID=2904122 RepID=A0ABY6F5W6_9GAMM|nr:4-phosphoerythronate dehydrogenase [Moraxella nasicaprae]UXZ05482.1 4-phosphoerythronate dehydrogenase [Moraxella nasicaprae]
MLTIIADENIANIDDYLGHHQANIIKMHGRDITGGLVKAHQADALFVRSVTPINAHTFGDLSKTSLKFVGSATIGTDHIDQAFLAKHHISFANAAGCSKHSVAQYVISAILHLRPNARHQAIKLGIIGLGNIGRTLATYAKKFGWQVIGYDPHLPINAINQHDFDTLLSDSDVVSIHTPLVKDGNYPTFGLFDKQTLAKLNPAALLINTARGEIIDEQALLDDIAHTKRQVVLDVFPSEPVISDALMRAITLATPHIAGYTLEGKLRGTDMIYQAFCTHFGLVVSQDLNSLLPDNAHHFDEFYRLSGDDVAHAIASYYPINADHQRLSLVNHHGVLGDDFDKLRKTYPLRREWLSE